MMSLQEEKITAPIFFREYVNGRCVLNIGNYEAPIILSNSKIIEHNDKISDVTDIKKSHIELILLDDPEVVIIGTGEKQLLPHADIINEVAKSGKSIDFMPSKVACKTYNLLVSENRSVSCIII
jgi:uncharacterized protein